MSWVTWITIEDESTSNEEVQQLYQRTRNPVTQKMSDTVRLTSLTPEVAGLLHDLNQAVHRHATGLSAREQEIVALVTAAYNGCVH